MDININILLVSLIRYPKVLNIDVIYEYPVLQ